MDGEEGRMRDEAGNGCRVGDDGVDASPGIGVGVAGVLGDGEEDYSGNDEDDFKDDCGDDYGGRGDFSFEDGYAGIACDGHAGNQDGDEDADVAPALDDGCVGVGP